MKRRFQLLDVFGAGPYLGNPLAVVIDGSGLTSAQMQQLARWTNLSETAFLLPPTSPEADYRVRIFTLAAELPFAGHPTLGSCRAWLAAGGQPRDPGLIVQQCGAGLIRLRESADRLLSFSAPPLRRAGPVDRRELTYLCGGLRISVDDVVDAQWVDNGPGWVALLLSDAAAVLAVEPAFARSRRSVDVGLVGFHAAGSECAIEVRAFFTDERGDLREDPVTGSLNASLGQWLLSTGRLTAPYMASQGTCLGRRGRVRITQDADGSVWVGGQTYAAVEGLIDI